jgi:3-phosphoshikimate 1-carboxyvinyltransferase
MVRALRALGTPIDDTEEGTWTVEATGFGARAARIDVGNAGTVLRFVPPIAALANAAISFDGDEAVRRRPVSGLLRALRALGVDIDGGAAPFVVHGHGRVGGGGVEIDASASSQLVSALLLAGARYDQGVEIRHVGDRPVPNAPHLAMTAAMLAARGVQVSSAPTHWSVAPGTIKAVDTTIEPDLSSAAPFAAAAVVTAGEVRIHDWPATSSQPGAMLPALLEQFGAATSLDADGLTVRGADTITGADLDLRDAGELTPVLAAIASVATTPSRLVGIAYLRGHETDRLAALVHELTGLGAQVRELDDGLEIVPKPLRGSIFSTYDDHRMAMAAAVIGLVVPDLKVANVETTAKTLPGFVQLWTAAIESQGAPR